MYDILCMHLVGLIRENEFNFCQCETSGIMSHIQRHQLILHKERVFFFFALHSTAFKRASSSDIKKMPIIGSNISVQKVGSA